MILWELEVLSDTHTPHFSLSAGLVIQRFSECKKQYNELKRHLIISCALHFPQNYQKSNYPFQNWDNHSTHRVLRKCSLLVCKIKKTETFSFFILSASVYRMPTMGQVLCWLLVLLNFSDKRWKCDYYKCVLEYCSKISRLWCSLILIWICASNGNR